MIFSLKMKSLSKNSINMSEPWYESQSVTIPEGIVAFNNWWFCQQMRMTTNGYESNKQLQDRIIEMKDNTSLSRVIARGNPGAGQRAPNNGTNILNAASNATRVTFESLRYNTPNWEQELTKIVEEEVNREHRKFNGLGSRRGFYSFALKSICKAVLARVIIEMWALPTIKRRLKKYARACVECRFAPGATGFLESQQHFMELVCVGCRQGQANQEAHMDIGGCLYLPPPSKLVRENAMNLEE